MAILVAVLVLLLAAFWGYLAFTQRQSGDMGYLVRGSGYGAETEAEYKTERQTGYGARTEKEESAEPHSREVEIYGIKYEEEGKVCHG